MAFIDRLTSAYRLGAELSVSDAAEATRSNEKETLLSRALLAIPTLNEEDGLPSVLRQARRLGVTTVVVDGGSTDGTLRIAREFDVPVVGVSRGKGRGWCRYPSDDPAYPAPQAMKVTHLVQFFQPEYVGGIQRYVAELAKRQEQEGVDVSILTVALPTGRHHSGNGKAADPWYRDNGPLKVMSRKSWGVFQRTPIYPGLVADIRRLDADVVHLHGPSPWFEAALRLARPLRARLVLTLHNTFPQTTVAQRWLGRVGQKLLHSTVKNADAVIAPHSEFLHDLVPEPVLRRSEGRVHYLPPGVDRDRYRPLDLVRDDKLVLFVAHLRPEKGLHVLVEAMSMLPGLRLDVLATVSYEDRYYRKVRGQAEVLLGPRVRFVLSPGPEALVEAYNRAACVVVPSLGLESWNLVLSEAAACGAACVRSDLPGLSWADFALTTPPDELQLVARAIERAIAQREDLGAKAKRAVNGYTWERTCQETLAAYRHAGVGA